MMRAGAIEIQDYLKEDTTSPYAKWFNGLDAIAAVKIATAIIRMENGNLSNIKNVGGGVYENKINFGPGYRVYFGRDGGRLVILLGGGTKKRQS